MAKKSWILIDAAANPRDSVCADSLTLEAAEVGTPNTRIDIQTLQGGLRDGIRLLTVDNGRMRVAILPDRGMGIWKIWSRDADGSDWQLGWNSPVRGPVHPKLVPIGEPSGLGWLDGFDELLCRCGLFSNGAPDFSERGVLLNPLHGRIANRPAHRLTVETDGESGEIRVTGVVDECRFHFQKLRLKSTIRLRAGETRVDIIDQVTNLSGAAGEMQLLYHINFGPPLVEPGSHVMAPIRRLMPRDEHSAQSVREWNRYGQPRAGAIEDVFFCELLPGANGFTEALLSDAGGNRGASLRYHTAELPYFSLWKNGPKFEDGYVTGLEPATNFPNPRSFEASKGRVRKLAPGETVQFQLTLEPLETAAAISEAARRIQILQAPATSEICTTPQPGWTQAK
jgi:galactose mutarotase-like enzyme